MFVERPTENYDIPQFEECVSVRKTEWIIL